MVGWEKITPGFSQLNEVDNSRQMPKEISGGWGAEVLKVRIKLEGSWAKKYPRELRFCELTLPLSQPQKLIPHPGKKLIFGTWSARNTGPSTARLRRRMSYALEKIGPGGGRGFGLG